MATYTDGFTNSDGTPLATHNANWTGFSTGIGTLNTTGGQLAGSGMAVYAQPLTADCYVQAKVGTGRATYTNMALILRRAADATSSTHISCIFRSDQIYLYDSSGSTVWSASVANPIGQVCRVEAEGTTIRIYRNGALYHTYTGAVSTGGTGKYAGVHLNTNVYWDDWEAGTIVSSIPSDPSNVTVGTITNAGATVSWTDNSTGETGFAVEYAVSPYQSWTAAAESPATADAVSLAITGLSGGTTYKARVRATAAGGNSAYVESAEFTTRQRGSPTSTVSAGAWTASGAATLHEAVDEIVASDTDYGFTQASSAMKLGFNVLQAPEAGTRSISYAIWSPSGANMAVILMEGDTTIQSWPHTPAPVQKTIFTQPITNAVTDWANLRVQVEGN